MEMAIAKTNKYASRESGDTAEIVERPGGVVVRDARHDVVVVLRRRRRGRGGPPGIEGHDGLARRILAGLGIARRIPVLRLGRGRPRLR